MNNEEAKALVDEFVNGPVHNSLAEYIRTVAAEKHRTLSDPADPVNSVWLTPTAPSLDVWA